MPLTWNSKYGMHTCTSLVHSATGRIRQPADAGVGAGFPVCHSQRFRLIEIELNQANSLTSSRIIPQLNSSKPGDLSITSDNYGSTGEPAALLQKYYNCITAKTSAAISKGHNAASINRYETGIPIS